jgi:hypothetical protein
MKVVENNSLEGSYCSHRLAPENKIDRQLLTALLVKESGDCWRIHKFSGSEIAEESTILFDSRLQWDDDGVAVVTASFDIVPFDPMKMYGGSQETIKFWVEVDQTEKLTAMWGWGDQSNCLPYTPTFPRIKPIASPTVPADIFDHLDADGCPL